MSSESRHTSESPTDSSSASAGSSSADGHPSQFQLLRQRRFAPYFVTQVLGAFNDNVYKNALVALIAFSGIASGASSAGQATMLINLAAGLFILPFFLFSAIAGNVADKYEKSFLIRRIKLAEIVIMITGIVGFAIGNLPLQFAVLFLMGVQSAFFGPIKYGILPQHLSKQELVGGNGLVELGTFLAILLGTIVGTQSTVRAADGNTWPVSIILIVVAVTGYLSSRSIPESPANDPDLQVSMNWLKNNLSLVKYTYKNRVIFQSILGISWFWFMGASYLAQFPVFASDVLGGGSGQAGGNLFTLLLALFSVGIGVGSALCERLSHGRVEIGLVPFGSFGLTFFGAWLYLATPAEPLGVGIGLLEFLSTSNGQSIVAAVLGIGVFGGFYIVPLYAVIQARSRPDRLARAIACNNIMNAVFMVLSAALAIALTAMGVSIAGLFLTLVILNTCVALYIFRQVPEFLMRFLIWILIHTLYRVRTKDLANIPESGAAVLVANHVSFVDALIIGGSVQRPVRFVMYHKIFKIPLLNFIFRTARAIPIAGRKEDSAMYEQAFERMRQALDNGELVCIFPEGQITRDGDMNEFRPGVTTLISDRPVPVVPMALRGLWGSLFSRSGGRAFFKLPRRFFAKIELVVGEPIAPNNVDINDLHQTVHSLRGDKR